MPGSRDDDRRGDRTQRGARNGADRTGRRDDPPRGPRPPIKGRRRTFDEDSAPNARERERLDRRPAADDGATGDGLRRGERWVDEGPVRRAAGEAAARGARRPPRGRGAERAGRPQDTTSDNTHRRRQRATKRAEQALEIDRERLVRQLGAAKADRSIARLGEAADAFAQDRYEDARRLLKPLADAIPAEPAIRELYGLALYRLGRWRPAIVELEAFAQRTGSVEQHPVLGDCYRALGRHERVQELWDELGETSPEAAVVAEGRIVLAGSFADQGQLPKAIATLEQGSLGSKKLKYHHLRMRYVLADLYDRAGEHHAARRQFEAVAANDPDFFDVRDRLRQL
ncbi:MAG: tetratricopeptide repeat protein [Acidimicrobiales bacterium]